MMQLRARWRWVVLGGVAAAMSLQGCGFLEGHSEHDGDRALYIGTIRDVEHITGQRHVGGSCVDFTEVVIPFYVLDLPISFGLDTVLFPFTLLYDLCTWPAPTPKRDVPVENGQIPAEKK
jgi:uncharacterized protein YceK